jgi:hypothetical protein
LKKERRSVRLVAELLLVVGFLCFAIGYIFAGGAKAQVLQYTYGENMTINLSIPDLSINQQVQIYKGMTPVDAILRVTGAKFQYYPGSGAMVTEIGGIENYWGYKVNGELPLGTMQEYQLSDGDNLLLFKLVW